VLDSAEAESNPCVSWVDAKRMTGEVFDQLGELSL